LVADCDWACLQLLMAYQLVAKEVGRIMSWLNAMSQLECRRLPITWWVCSRIPLAWGFLTMVNLDLIPYDWSSWNLAETNSVPLSCKQPTGWGYQQSQTWSRVQSMVMLSLFFKCHNFHEMHV
jgi:hypothetical protein